MIRRPALCGGAGNLTRPQPRPPQGRSRETAWSTAPPGAPPKPAPWPSSPADGCGAKGEIPRGGGEEQRQQLQAPTYCAQASGPTGLQLRACHLLPWRKHLTGAQRPLVRTRRRGGTPARCRLSLVASTSCGFHRPTRSPKHRGWRGALLGRLPGLSRLLQRPTRTVPALRQKPSSPEQNDPSPPPSGLDH